MRWADLDLLGHVNNVVHVDYLQEARVDLLRRHGGRDAMAARGEGVVVARHEVSYRRPLLFVFGSVSVESWVSQVRAASFVVEHEVFLDRADPAHGRAVFVRARSLLTPFVFTDDRPRRLSADERASLEELLEPEDGARPRTPRVPDRPPAAGASVAFPVTVRFSDLDVYGHVNNVRYVEYFQEARLVFLERLWGHLPGRLGGPGLVVAQTDVDYVTPAVMRPEPYVVHTWVARVGGRSATLEAVLVDPLADDRVCARGRVTIVFVDADGAATAPSDEQRAALEASLVAVEDHR